MTIVIGIDPSLTRTGIATPAGLRSIKSEGREDATLEDRALRLHNLNLDILIAVFDGKPLGDDVLVVIEAPSLGQGRQRGTMDRVGLWWMIVDSLIMEPGVAVAQVTPSQRMKYATGDGRADKDEVLAAVIKRFPDHDVRSNDEADALVFRAIGMDYLGAPLAVMPARNREVLTAIKWPEVTASWRIEAGDDDGE